MAKHDASFCYFVYAYAYAYAFAYAYAYAFSYAYAYYHIDLLIGPINLFYLLVSAKEFPIAYLQYHNGLLYLSQHDRSPSLSFRQRNVH